MANEIRRGALPRGKKNGGFSLSPKEMGNIVSKLSDDAIKAYENYTVLEQERERTRQIQEQTKQQELKFQVEFARIDAERQEQTQKNYVEMLQNEWVFLDKKQKNLIALISEWRNLYAGCPSEELRARIFDNIEELQSHIISIEPHRDQPNVMKYIESVRRDLHE